MTEFRQQELAELRSRSVPGGDRAHRGDGLTMATALGNRRTAQLLGAVQRRDAGGRTAQRLDESVALAIEERRGQGRPLDGDIQSQMEGALGQDLSDVRIHTDETAHQLNRAVSARAFTTGGDVFFKQGAYDPGSSSGRGLLAHELTHVVQQRDGTSGLASGEVSDPSDAAEQDAEAVGKTVAQAGTAAHSSDRGPSTSSGVARSASDGEIEDPVAKAADSATSVSRHAEAGPEEGIG